jgi:hypothetical protein
MLRCLLPFVFLISASSLRADDDIVVSPHRSFRIVQHREGEGVKETLEFLTGHHRVVTLEYAISWPASYYISPDERWILRIQKSGSGDNISWLYQLETATQRLWRMEEQLGALGFDYLEKDPSLPHNLYHTGIAFIGWDLTAGELHFSIHGSDADQSGHGVDRRLTYSLRKHAISSP